MKEAASKSLVDWGIFLTAYQLQTLSEDEQARIVAERVEALLDGEAFCDSGVDENVCFIYLCTGLSLIISIGCYQPLFS